MTRFFAVVQRGDLLIPIIKGGDAPDAECMATWPSRAQAQEEAESVPLGQAFPVLVFDLEDAS